MNKGIIDLLDKYDIKYQNDEELKWIFINGHKSKYIVSSYGYIISFNFHHRTPVPIILKDKISKTDGYHRVILVYNGKKYTFLVHRLVAKAFIKNPKNKVEVNHINGNKNMNNVENLEWATRVENQKHAYKNELIHPTYGNAKLSLETVEEICQMIKDNIPDKEILNRIDVLTRDQLTSIKHGRSWTNISKKYIVTKPGPVKLTNEQKSVIYNLLLNNIPVKEIIKITGVSQTSIYRIKNRMKKMNNIY